MTKKKLSALEKIQLAELKQMKRLTEFEQIKTLYDTFKTMTKFYDLDK